MNDGAWSGIAAVAGVGLCAAGIARAVRAGRWPRLAEPDPNWTCTVADRVRYFAANLLALALGAAIGGGLWLLPVVALPTDAVRSSAYDGAGRVIGPLFLGLGAAALVAVPLAARFVRPEALAIFLWRSARPYGGADLRPALRWLALVVSVLAIALHLQLRSEHTTLVGDQLRWRGVFAWSDNVEPLADVRDAQLVQRFRALAGNVVERPHLVLVFADGQRLRIGRDADKHPPPQLVALMAAIPRRLTVALREVDEEQ